MRQMWLAALLPIAALGVATAGQELTYVELVHRLTDLERLAVLPQPGERCAQCSSYDRRSRYDVQNGQYVNWAANGDGRGMIRAEDGRWVMAEMAGPGCIRRIWSARPGTGRVSIYLDGSSEPAVDLPFSGYFDGRTPPFVYPSLVYTAASGKNCYVPIPYRKSCKIVAEKGWGDYYHFTYQTFPKGTVVPTFTRELAPEERAALQAADAFLTNDLGTDPAGRRQGQVSERRRLTVPAGETIGVANIEGPRAITKLEVRISLAGREQECAALRELALRITWDGEDKPAVWAPLGDFFGTAPGINRYRSLPVGMTDEGLYSYWYMPFSERALVEVTNAGSAPRSLEFTIVHAPLSRPINTLGRLHAKWHRDAFLPAEPGRAIDWTMLRTRGRGRFCGVMLHVWNPRGGWWGEGDEKFFVDGEAFPSTFGTGSEDYFGYAWCNPSIFRRAYHNQTFNPRGNRGHVSVNRWHITDSVPFQDSFEGAIEKYYPNARGTLYACTVYWYLAPRGEDPYEPAPVEERTGYFAEPQAFREPGALEGEKLEVLHITGGQARTQDMFPFGEGWSSEAHLWWTGGKPGDRLVLGLPVALTGRYELKAQLTKARDYGIVRLYLDGGPLGGPVDLFNPSVTPSGAISLGVHELTQGGHRLTVEITGARQEAVKAYMFGLDWLKLEGR